MIWAVIVALGIALPGLVSAATTTTLFSDDFSGPKLAKWINVDGKWGTVTERNNVRGAVWGMTALERLDTSIDARGHESLKVTFMAKIDKKLERRDRIVLEWSDGTTWTPIAQIAGKKSGWKSYTYTLPPAANDKRITLRFRGDFGSNERSRDAFYIDDVKVAGVEKAPVVIPALNAPTNLQGDRTPTEIALRWDDDSIQKDYYVVERKHATTTAQWHTLSTTTQKVFVDTTTSIFDRYWYRVYSTKGVATSSWSNEYVAASTSATVNLGMVDLPRTGNWDATSSVPLWERDVFVGNNWVTTSGFQFEQLGTLDMATSVKNVRVELNGQILPFQVTVSGRTVTFTGFMWVPPGGHKLRLLGDIVSRGGETSIVTVDGPDRLGFRDMFGQVIPLTVGYQKFGGAKSGVLTILHSLKDIWLVRDQSPESYVPYTPTSRTIIGSYSVFGKPTSTTTITELTSVVRTDAIDGGVGLHNVSIEVNGSTYPIDTATTTLNISPVTVPPGAVVPIKVYAANKYLYYGYFAQVVL